MASEKICLALAFLSLAACSSAAKKPTVDPQQQEIAQLRNQVASLTGQIETLESKLAAMTEKAERTGPAITNAKPAQPAPVTGHAGDARGVPIEAEATENDPEAGFVNDAAVTSYRQAMILFKTRKYAESILAFSSFLERYADHALAGSAQFLVGESYYQQKEHRLAHQEFSRVLTSYDRSPHVPEALARIAELEDQLKKPSDAAKHRQLLTSLFPSSPAAAVKGSSRTEAPRANSLPSAAAPAQVQSPASGKPSSQIDEAPATAPVPTSQGEASKQENP
jgi:tol-pal system protein YbgF